MKYNYLFVILITLGFIACSDPLDEDYRLAFTGIYDCIKNPDNNIFPEVNVEIEVLIDSSNMDNVIIANKSIPISEEGTFGPAFLEPDLNYELRIEGDSIYIESYNVIISGIVAPCVLVGVKRE